jgi:hypothetical protein
LIAAHGGAIEKQNTVMWLGDLDFVFGLSNPQCQAYYDFLIKPNDYEIKL